MRFLTILFTFLAFQVSAQQALSLAQAIELGLANNYQIKIAQADVAIAENNNDWSLTGKYPSIDLSFAVNNNYVNSDNPASVLLKSSTLSNGLQPAIGANWVLFNGYRVTHSKAQLEGLATLSNEQLRTQVQSSIQMVIQAYYRALIQREQLDVLEEILTLSRDRVNYQKVRQEFGQAGSFDLLQSQDAYLNDSTSYLVQQSTYANAMRSLNLAMGMDASQDYSLSEELNVENESYQFADLEQQLLNNNPDLKSLTANRQLANINAKLQSTSRYPTVSLNAGANYNINWQSGSQTFNFNPDAVDIPSTPSKTWQGFLNLSASYNLWDGGAKNRRIETAKLQEIQSQLSYENLLQTLKIQLANTLATYENQNDLVNLTGQLVENASQNLGIAEERYKGGLINSFDYRSIQLSYINATQAQLNAIFNLKNTETELMRLIGGLVR